MKEYVVYIEDNPIKDTPEKESFDDKLIEDALGKIKKNGGGELRWARTLKIKKEIKINYKEYGALSFQGIGEISKIVVSKNVDKLESVITIDYGDDNLDNFETDQYGARSIKMENIYIDCNENAKHGLVLGVHHPVVQSNFKMINIVKSTDYGLVLDSTQNSHFDLVNVEQCGGSLLLLNGAGNNVFTKCEFNENTNLDLHLISFEERHYKNEINKEEYFSWTDTSKNSTRFRNGFENTAQMNTFINPVIERFKGKHSIYFGKANNNYFINAEIEYDDISNGGACIYISENSSFNKINMRLCCSSKVKEIPIINNGFANTFYDSFVQECYAPAIIKSSKVVYCRNILTNNNAKILILDGVEEGHAYNVDRNIKYFYNNNDINSLEIGQIGFRDNHTPGGENDLLIKLQNGQIFRIMTEKYEDKYKNHYQKKESIYYDMQKRLNEINEKAKSDKSLKKILDKIDEQLKENK